MRHRWNHATLYTRLTLIVCGAVAFACGFVGLVTDIALDHYLMKRLDTQLQLASDRYAHALRTGDGDDSNRVETATVGQEVGTLTVRRSGNTIRSLGVVTDGAMAATLTAEDRTILEGLPPRAHPADIELPALGEYRVLVIADANRDVLITGLPLRDVERTRHSLQGVKAVLFVAVTLIVGALAAFLIRRTLRPLDHVTDTALRVSQIPMEELGQRVHERVDTDYPYTEAGRVAVAMNRMLDRMDSALVERRRSEDRLREFVADASHELRTPLTAVRAHAELLLRDCDHATDEQRNSIMRISGTTQRMTGLVEDLLMLARLDAGQELRHESVDLTRMAVESIEDSRLAAPDHVWQLDLPEEPVVVLGDLQRLHQVINNLLTNARVHTPAGSKVLLHLRQEPTCAVLSVIDDGPGIPAEMTARVLERFVRGDAARSRRTGGSGLGLAIVRSIVEAHGGEITIDSVPGRTGVTVRIPSGAA